jgi:glycosyltransferase involved in cell wall biosynthesis
MDVKPVAIAPVLAIVVPCYNEEEVLPETARRLGDLMDRMVLAGKVSTESTIRFVDDGSRDRTWQLIEELAVSSPRFRGVKLSRNRGHQNALLAGVFSAEGDAVVTIDADLQDDIEVIAQMVDHFNSGTEIVYGVRESRTSDTAFKRGTAEGYYRLLKLMGVDLVFNHADYRLMSRRALQCLQEYSEVNMFLRGIIPLLGFRTATVFYARSERFAGESKYPLRKMLALAIDGVTSFSVAPLRFISLLGFLVCAFSLVMVGIVLYGKLVQNGTIPGWASSVLPIYFLGGVQLLSIGILGEYVAKIYLESKRRPRFFVEKTV